MYIHTMGYASMKINKHTQFDSSAKYKNAYGKNKLYLLNKSQTYAYIRSLLPYRKKTKTGNGSRRIIHGLRYNQFIDCIQYKCSKNGDRHKQYHNYVGSIYIPDLLAFAYDDIIFLIKNFEKIPMQPKHRQAIRHIVDQINMIQSSDCIKDPGHKGRKCHGDSVESRDPVRVAMSDIATFTANQMKEMTLSDWDDYYN